jgi:16S rRNA (guanine527-N7)-methyltransferase
VVSSEEFREQLLARARLARIDVSERELGQLEHYFRLLARWNEKINLTALPLANPTNETFDRLLVEPLIFAPRIKDSSKRWFDLGSGGGSPAIPLKIARPGLRLIMVESKARKAAFLSEVVRQLQLTGINVENCRFEALAADRRYIESATLVTARAVRVDDSLLGVAEALLAPRGQLILFGHPTIVALGSAFQSTETPGLYWKCST